MHFILMVLFFSPLVIAPLALVAVLVTAIFGVVPWGNQTAAAWWQAIGSILAVLGAATFPYWHSRKNEDNKKQALLEVLSELSDEASEELWLLTNLFFSPDTEVLHMKEYLGYGRAHNWPGLVAAIEQVPIMDLPPDRASDLGKIRNAVSFGAFVVSELPNWIKESCSHPEVVSTLRNKRALLDIARIKLPKSKRKPDVSSAREIGRRVEEKRGFPEPLNVEGVKVYRRFVWSSDEDRVPVAAYVQLVFQYGDQFPLLEEVPNSSAWTDFDEVDEAAREHARKVIDAFK
ncbi:sulfite exporter TauE/SafE family protein [Azotobacter chroococcum]|uniref:sulfite exporter TauE/SafE family protein n=1 Tax=Azotobacter chroococcum TaxID=353 RepID=UPI0010AE166D|nr:sulfite exporter TauE/SafE family protein [Azotobacter chroococcum]TKD40733.1 sulfite exporter TauE/SafE family protein [Azotobacter chroococcum]